MVIRLVIKFTTVSEECQLYNVNLLMRVQHSDASVKMVIMVLEHITMISMNVNLINAKTNNTATRVQLALQCM